MTETIVQLTEEVLIFTGIVFTFGAVGVIQSKMQILQGNIGNYLILAVAVLLVGVSKWIANKIFRNESSFGNKFTKNFINRFGIVLFFFVLSIWLRPVYTMNPWVAYVFGIFIIVLSPIIAKAVFK